MRNEKTRQETAHLNLIEHTILTLDFWQDNVTYTEVKTPLNAEQEKVCWTSGGLTMHTGLTMTSS